ncbi:MAG TPA: FlgD immunoglobulin-like domain containing protein [Candidatus Eisenbacteria bacterium]|nr:FlgD immunoglobulin-like domain containing protein [Candidatus Eisenbacteria bacterium]
MRSFVLLYVISLACPARADLVLNEVLYDPAGADEGMEFVELWNGDDLPRALAGIAIEAGDGAHPEAWVVIHRGQPSDSVPPHAAYLVSGLALVGPIQNGPDAVRLTRDGVPLDRLGWGDLESGSLFESAPAPDVPSGHSLARREDGRDGDSNAADWADEAAPTPGRANHPEERLVFDRASATVTPIVAWPGEPMMFVANVRNRGRLDLAGTRWRLVADAEPPAMSPGVSLASGESALVSLSIPAPQSGAFLFRARLEVAEGVPTADLADTAVVPVRCVAAPAVIHEIAFRDAGSGEWVELWFREPVPDVGLFALADATASPRAIERGPTPRPAAAGEFLIIAQDPTRVASNYGLAAGAVLGVVGGWPSLNDVLGASGFSDVVRLFGPGGPGGPGGSPSDAVPYRSDAATRGGSLERLSPDLPSAAPGSWGECVDPSRGTPGLPNSLRAPEPGASPRGPLLVASANVLRRAGATPLLFRLTPEARHLALTVDVRDLLGRARRVLLRGQRFVSEGAFAWDGRDDAGQPVPAGIYIVRAEGVSEGTRPRVSVLAVAVSGEAR